MSKTSYKFIAVEGNIGAGKTTLATLLSKYLGGKLLLERFEENPYLKDFYQDPAQFALLTEQFFLNDRLRQIETIFNSEHSLIISDFTIYKSFLFSKLTLPESLKEDFGKVFNESLKKIPQPDLIIHLKSESQQVKKQILQRGREYELNISTNYLENIETAYLNYWKTQRHLNVLLIEATEFTYPYKNEDIERFVKYIETAEIKGFTLF